MRYAAVFFLLAGALWGVEISAGKSEEDKRLDTIKYGTETEIASLIETLKGESEGLTDARLEAELVSLSQNTRNQNILTGLLGFFGERAKTGLEERALRAVTERDDEAHATVLSAIDYLGKVRAEKAVAPLEELLDADEARYMNAAFRALGRACQGGAGKDQVAEYLSDFYTNRNPPDQSRWEIVAALGETGSARALPLLSEIAQNNEERPVVRMAAVEGLSKIGDQSGLPPILGALAASDPNVRAAAIGALGPFSGQEVDAAILESFRDSYYRARIGAAKAAGQRKLAGAVPYLQYRAEYDEVPAVKDEAVKALGAIGNGESAEILAALFGERKVSDRVRILAAETLVSLDAGTYADRVAAEMDDAKKRNQTALYNGFL
ncbi:MAG: HEAT repeat domain-containing protein, partial [Spirochaetaceae bacterium]|nr:HEAT repeat domain-containing protein [Spirochaetaceae bacterium]